MRPAHMGVSDRCLWDEDSGSRRPPAPVPRTADVAIVGGGYTGLSAARTLVRHGTDAVVLEGETLGWGASGRNGGFVLPGFQPGLGELVRRGGAAWGGALFRQSLEAVRFLETLIQEERIPCDYARSGAITLADRPSHLRELEAEQRTLREVGGHDTVLLDRPALVSEIGSRRYHGGLLDPGAGALHPARFCAGLARAAERAGAKLVEVRQSCGRRVAPVGSR